MLPKFEVIYMRGNFPAASDPDIGRVVRDAKTAISLPQEVFSRIVADLRAYPGFMDQDDIHTVVQNHVTDAASVSTLSRLIGGVPFSKGAETGKTCCRCL